MSKIKTTNYFLLSILLFFLHQPIFSQFSEQKSIYRKQLSDSMVLLVNQDNILPFFDLNTKFASLLAGCDSLTPFQKRLSDYADFDHFNISGSASENEINNLSKNLQSYKSIVCGLYISSDQDINKLNIILEKIQDSEKLVIVLFGEAKWLNSLHLNPVALIVAHNFTDDAQDLAAQLIFGGIGFKGVLHENIEGKFKKGDGIKTDGGMRFQFCQPEDLGLNSHFINWKVDSIADNGVKAEAFPGCQVLAAKDGKIFFHKTYGYQTFDSILPVQKSDLYDFASITKITASLPCIMKLVDEGKINLDAPLSKYWPDFKHSNKKNLIFRDILAHQAQLTAWIPFWKKTIKKNGNYRRNTISSDSSENYPVKLTGKMYLHKNYKNKIYKAIKKSDIQKEKKYVYSDLSFILYPEIIKRVTGIDFEVYLKQNFYNSLGANSLGFNPLYRFSKNKIIPTENDTFFRKEQIHGTVHDEGAIMLGGVSGHAGLFGSSLDLAKIMQMYLDSGKYGNIQYISEKTMKDFTRCQFPENNNRRGLGFDKPILKDNSNGTSAKNASYSSFGHSGFTGTFCWADPENGLLYIFMSNRVYPTRENSKIGDLNIRPSIQQVFYDALKMAKPLK